MTAKKWGESFLKSGLPLEHLTQVTFRSLEWMCQPAFEYARPNRDNQENWFEVDLFASAPIWNKSTGLAALVECKYHDLSRSWFFLPHASEGRWEFDDRVLNCGPYQTLKEAHANSLLKLAPLSDGGIVVSEDGTKQDNAVYTAIQQLVNAFLPCCLDHMFMYNIDFHNVERPSEESTYVPGVTALVPMIVTNAALYRLKPPVSDLDAILAAVKPEDIADLVSWTWCYYDLPIRLWHRNFDIIKAHTQKHAALVYRFPGIEDSMHRFVDRPNWIAVINIRSLSEVLANLMQAFQSVPTTTVEGMLRPPRSRRTRRRPTRWMYPLNGITARWSRWRNLPR